MVFYKEIELKDGRKCILRNAEAEDAEAFYDYFIKAHAETDFLTTYPDENKRDINKTASELEETKKSATDIEICAFVDGVLAGSAGNVLLRDRDKTRHRAEFGISIIKEYWGLGIGKILTELCVNAAREAGFLQLELEVVADNSSAVSLYKKTGFIEYGRNPRGFRNRQGQWQELLLMRLELE